MGRGYFDRLFDGKLARKLTRMDSAPRGFAKGDSFSHWVLMSSGGYFLPIYGIAFGPRLTQASHYYPPLCLTLTHEVHMKWLRKLSDGGAATGR